MITKDGTRVTGKLAMEALAKPAWLREAFVSYEGHSDEAEVTSFQGYQREFGFAAPAMPGEPAKEPPQPHREKDIDHLRSGCFTTIEEMKWAMGHVCLPMEPREWKSIPEAMKAVEEEYAKLRKRGAWDEKESRNGELLWRSQNK